MTFKNLIPFSMNIKIEKHKSFQKIYFWICTVCSSYPLMCRNSYLVQSSIWHRTLLVLADDGLHLETFLKFDKVSALVYLGMKQFLLFPTLQASSVHTFPVIVTKKQEMFSSSLNESWIIHTKNRALKTWICHSVSIKHSASLYLISACSACSVFAMIVRKLYVAQFGFRAIEWSPRWCVMCTVSAHLFITYGKEILTLAIKSLWPSKNKIICKQLLIKLKFLHKSGSGVVVNGVDVDVDVDLKI